MGVTAGGGGETVLAGTELLATRYQGCRPIASIIHWILVHCTSVQTLLSTRPPVSPAGQNGSLSDMLLVLRAYGVH